MAFFSQSFLTIAALVLSLLSCTAYGQLSSNYYSNSCPNLLNIVSSAMSQRVSADTSMAAGVLRLFFHDCFVNGCDASVLLDRPSSEKNALPNANSLRGFDVIDFIKAQVEQNCPKTVSCADILALAARDGVSLLGGPSWSVLLGRRDSTSADINAANINLPRPDFNIGTLISSFQGKGLDARDMTALSGAHTIGRAQSRNLAPLDGSTPDRFDNVYYQNLVARKGVFQSDQELFNNGPMDSLVLLYSSNTAAFFNDFANAMVKMGNIGPLTGPNGVIRSNCRSAF